jgi:hypothetical protein
VLPDGRCKSASHCHVNDRKLRWGQEGGALQVDIDPGVIELDQGQGILREGEIAAEEHTSLLNEPGNHPAARATGTTDDNGIWWTFWIHARPLDGAARPVGEAMD